MKHEVDTALRRMLKRKGLSFALELQEKFGVDRKTILRGVALKKIKQYYLEGYVKPFYSSKEVEDYFRQKEVCPRDIKINTQCKMCGKFYTYTKNYTCSGLYKEKVEKKLIKPSRTVFRRKYCNVCYKKVTRFTGHSKESKEKIADWTRNWWANLTQSEREKKTTKMSCMKKRYWESKKGRKTRKKLSMAMKKRGARSSEIMKEAWNEVCKSS